MRWGETFFERHVAYAVRCNHWNLYVKRCATSDDSYFVALPLAGCRRGRVRYSSHKDATFGTVELAQDAAERWAGTHA